MINKAEYEFLTILVKQNIEALDKTGMYGETSYYKAQCKLYEKLLNLSKIENE